MAGQGQGTKTGGDFHYQRGSIFGVAGFYVGPRGFGLVGIKHQDAFPSSYSHAVLWLIKEEDYSSPKNRRRIVSSIAWSGPLLKVSSLREASSRHNGRAWARRASASGPVSTNNRSNQN